MKKKSIKPAAGKKTYSYSVIIKRLFSDMGKNRFRFIAAIIIIAMLSDGGSRYYTADGGFFTAIIRKRFYLGAGLYI